MVNTINTRALRAHRPGMAGSNMGGPAVNCREERVLATVGS